MKPAVMTGPVPAPLGIALNGRDKVLDLFACLTDVSRRRDLCGERWDDMWPAAERLETIRELEAAARDRWAEVRYLGEDDVSASSVLITEDVLDVAAVRSRMPALEHVVQFGRFAPAVADEASAEMSGVSVHEFERSSIRHVAEHAVALTLLLLRGLIRLDAAVKAIPPPRVPGPYAYNWQNAQPRSLADSSVCILGFGQVGQAIWRLLDGFRPARRTYWSRMPNPRMPGPHEPDLRRALDRADVAIVALPSTAATRGIIDRTTLRALGAQGILVNVSRGAVVDEESLVAALRERSLGAAGLDVFTKEPLPNDHPLRELGNVVLSPHVAGGSIGRMTIELLDLLDFCYGVAGFA